MSCGISYLVIYIYIYIYIYKMGTKMGTWRDPGCKGDVWRMSDSPDVKEITWCWCLAEHDQSKPQQEAHIHHLVAASCQALRKTPYFNGTRGPTKIKPWVTHSTQCSDASKWPVVRKAGRSPCGDKPVSSENSAPFKSTNSLLSTANKTRPTVTVSTLGEHKLRLGKRPRYRACYCQESLECSQNKQ